MKPCLLALLLLVFPAIGRAQELLFDADTKHSWNRLHRHFHARTTLDGKPYGQEGLEPLFVRRSKFVTEGDSHKQALALLDEFLGTKADQLVKDPLARAILQRDLWAVLVTTADPLLQRQPERRELQKRLAQVMRRVALTEREIESLSDNLAAAVKAKTVPAAFNANHPELPFLPDDSLSPKSPWVVVRSRLRKDSLAAPTHFEMTSGRSAFLILLRLPAGRAATEKFLASLEGIPRSALPQIPEGTQVALVRRTLLIDQAGLLRLSPLTEGVQIRVYEKLTSPHMIEIRLHRRDLFAARGGGLMPTGADESNYFDSGFLGLPPHGSHDPFEVKVSPPSDRLTPVVMKSCTVCHAGPGIYGFQSLFVDHFDSPPLGATTIEDQIDAHLNRVRGTYTWGLLQGLWET